MVNSMTGFGEGFSESGGITITATAKSVNSRFLEISVKLPDILNNLEHRANEIVATKLSRGKVYLNINISYATKTDVYDISFDEPLLDSYMNALASLDAFSRKISIVDILSLPDVLVSSPREGIIQQISRQVEEAVNGAIDSLMGMRAVEGKAIEIDIRERLDSIGNWIDELSTRKEMSREYYLDKLRDRISCLLENQGSVDEDRLLQEAAYLAQKSDPTEEIIRLESHIKQFRDVLGEKEPVGSKLRFILQESNREIDTIGAKGDTAETSNLVISIKEQLERIREQIHNVE